MPISERDQKFLRYGGIAVGVLLVLFLASKFLFGGGGGAPTTSINRLPSPTPTPTPTATKTPVPVAQFGGRDPFSTPPEFLVSSSTPGGGGSSSSSASSPGSSTSSPGGGGSSSSGPPPTQPGGGSSANIGGHNVVLLDAFMHNGVGHAQVEIDGVVYTVAEGEDFGPGHRFALRSVSGNCGTFVFGDESFTLCITPQK